MSKSSSAVDRITRRPFLKTTAAMLGSWAVSNSFSRLSAAPVRKDMAVRPLADEATGAKLLSLPEGFRYISFGWTGDKDENQLLTPPAHDGMAVISKKDGVVTLCRNHECGGVGTSFAADGLTYDANAPGGCYNLEFDVDNGRWIRSWASLAGTLKNCAGGPTPWGTWLSCEETVLGPDDKDDDGNSFGYDLDHGYIFEVPADGSATATAIREMGRFVHEAVAVAPDTGIVYETEDRTPAGFYRFLPKVKGQLSKGGRLQMMAIKGNPDLIKLADPNAEYDVSWVDIDEPERRHKPGTTDGGGVYHQGAVQGGTAFARLEGCWWGNEGCYFVSTSGGRTGSGQVWYYRPDLETLKLVFESPGTHVLDSPDNLTVSPRGGLVLCEDGDRVPQKMHALSIDGTLVELAANNLNLDGSRNGFSGDYRGSEWAGACFSPDGKWLFANLQTPGITFAITGPWESLGI